MTGCASIILLQSLERASRKCFGGLSFVYLGRLVLCAPLRSGTRKMNEWRPSL